MLAEHKEIAAQLDDILTESALGRNVIGVLSGCATMGKTTLLRAFNERAAASGATVLSVTSSRDERHLPYVTLGKLFDRPFPKRGPGADHSLNPVEAGDDPVMVARHGYEMVAELTEYGPVLITVDDVQYADAKSLRCLRYMTHNLRSRPLAIVLAWDSPLGEEVPSVLREFLYGPNVQRLHIGLPSLDGVEQMVTDSLGQVRAADLAPTYHALTGGNPLLVKALEEEAHSAETLAGSKFRQAVVLCVHQLGFLAVRVARRAAALGESADMSLLGRLSGLDPRITRRVVRKLQETGVFDGLGFRCEAARSAVLDAMPVDERSQLCYDAALLLKEAGEPPQVVIERLLAAGPLQQAWVLPLLEDEARRAVAGNRTRQAIEYLQFAVECCADQSRYYALKTRIAELYRLLESSTSDARFLALKAPVLAGRVGSDEALRVATARLSSLHFDDAVEIIDYVTAEHDASELGDEWHLTQMHLMSTYPGLIARLSASSPAWQRQTAPSAGRGTLALHAAHSLVAALTQQGEEQPVARAERVLQEGGIADGDLVAVSCAVLSLVYTDMLEEAAHWCDRLTTQALGRDEPVWQATIGALSALVALRRGQLDAAVERAEKSLAVISPDGEWTTDSALLLATLVEAHTATGNSKAAAHCLSRSVNPALFKTRAGLHYLYARGRHHLAEDRLHAALADFTACGERMVEWAIDTPALVPWRVGAAEAWLRMGRRDRATLLLEEQLGRWRGSLPRTQGITLRCLAAVRSAGERPAILEKALAMLQRSDDRYESSRVLTDLSEAYQILGNRAKARTAARQARRVGKSCFVERIRTQTPMAEVPAVSTVFEVHEMSHTVKDDHFAKLSGSERRVALLAAAGYSNREIAAKIYVTVSTVEQHLTRVYRKLSIRRREELPIDFYTDAV